MEVHGKEDLLPHLVQLAKIEHGIRELEPWVRDHVVHALLSFLVGIFVNKYLLKPAGQGIVAFQWKLAGLFHDVGYPVQIARDILAPYTDKINAIKRKLDVSRPDVSFRIVPVGLNTLANGVDSFDLIQTWIDGWQLCIDCRGEYERMIRCGRICHGMISALSVPYVVDLMYEKCNPSREYKNISKPPGISWNQSYFENDVVPACSAIFVHNLPVRCFQHARICRTDAPLPFLLRLSDCLQDWERPSAADPKGIPDDVFDVEVVGGKLSFTVRHSCRRRAIEQEIASSLITPDILVR